MAAYESVSVCAGVGLWIEVVEVVGGQRGRQKGVDWMGRWLMVDDEQQQDSQAFPQTASANHVRNPTPPQAYPQTRSPSTQPASGVDSACAMPDIAVNSESYSLQSRVLRG